MRAPNALTAVLSTAIALLFPSGPSFAAESSSVLCQARDDAAEVAAVNQYFSQNLKEHELHGFSKTLAQGAQGKAKVFLEQRIIDKRAEFCADSLKLAEEIKSIPSRVSGGAECSGAAMVTLLDRYMNKIAETFDQNRKLLGSLRDSHIKDIKVKLFELAKGSSSGLEGTYKGVPLASASQDMKLEWIKQVASNLGAEAHTIWGGAAPEKNPLVLKNLLLAREAMRVRQERDAAKARYHTDGRLGANCKLK